MMKDWNKEPACLKTMQPDENQQSPSPMPVLQRLDRLDHLYRILMMQLQYLEEKQGLSLRHTCDAAPTKAEQDEPYKSLSSALEEVHSKGTLIDRLAILENQVSQLSLKMEQSNTSRPSTITDPENIKYDMPRMQDERVTGALEKKQKHTIIQEKGFKDQWKIKCRGNRKSRKRKGNLLIMHNRKWFGWFKMGC